MKISIYKDADMEEMTVFNNDDWHQEEKEFLIGKKITNVEFDNEAEETILNIEEEKIDPQMALIQGNLLMMIDKLSKEMNCSNNTAKELLSTALCTSQVKEFLEGCIKANSTKWLSQSK